MNQQENREIRISPDALIALVVAEAEDRELSAMPSLEEMNAAFHPSEEFQKKLFEPFSREDNSMTNATQGTGLGLSIAKSIIAQMGGSIEVKSIQGKGTTFLVRLDLKLVEED